MQSVAAVAGSIYQRPIAWPNNREQELVDGRTFYVTPNLSGNDDAFGAFPLRVAPGEVRQTVLTTEEEHWFRLVYGMGVVQASQFANVWPVYVHIYSSSDWVWAEQFTPFQAVFGRPADREYPIPVGIIMPPGEDLVIEVLNDLDPGQSDLDVYMSWYAQRLLPEAAEREFAELKANRNG